MGDQGEPAALLVHKRRGWGAKHFARWYFWATHCRLNPIIDAAKTLKRHEAGLLSYFAHADHQRRRRRPQLAHPGDQGLCPRLPQP